jgi:hypothetical protein
MNSRMVLFLVLGVFASILPASAGTDFSYAIDGTLGPDQDVVARLSVTTTAPNIASVGARLTYDSSRISALPSDILVEKGSGVPASWSFTFLDDAVPGTIDLVIMDQSAAAAIIEPGVSPYTFEAVKLTFKRLAPFTCTPAVFGFNTVRPTPPGATFNAFPMVNQYIHVIDTVNHQVITDPASSLTPGTGPTVDDHAFIRGNVNNRSAHILDIGDVVDLASHLFLGYAPCFSCDAAYDVDDSGSKDITDLVTLVQGIFQPTRVTIPPPNAANPGPGIPGVVVPDGGAIPSVLGCADGETCPPCS